MAFDDEKKAGAVTEAENVSTSSDNDSLQRLATSQLDVAGQFLADHKDLDTSDVDISKIRHRVDRTVRALSFSSDSETRG